MPGRHVHFSQNAYPPTPSSTFSYTSSLPSPGGPITPPPIPYFGSPNACSPLPSVPSQINPVLGISRNPLLHYDLSLPPSTLQLHPTVSPLAYSEPATYPPLPCMIIISRHLLCPIEVRASGKHGPFVTVSDVLSAIYESLRMGMSEGEFNRITSPEARSRVDASYRSRYKRMSDQRAYEAERSKGLKRVDLLAGRNTFVGLASTLQGPDAWELHVS